MMGKSGHSALEYILTYGWAVLAVMVAGVIIYQVNILFVSTSISTSALGFSKLKPQLNSVSLANTGELQIAFTNGLSRQITVLKDGLELSVQQEGVCENIEIEGCIEDRCVVSLNHNFLITADSCLTGTPNKGRPYILDVEIPYELNAGNILITQTEKGTIRGPYE
ncbi:MAG: hypothetical protein KKD39_09075 [Candidatus Altiarchaeota archaeon]|nr:hypothetical protein [Candidatus Altiarchaeota archaeon]